MENLTHTLAGAVLARTRLARVTPRALPALVVAANLPDIDVFGGFFGANYLDFHRGITHSVVGVPALALLWSGAVWWFDRLRPPAGRAPGRFLPVLGAVLVALVSHPLLDFLNDYGVRPWLPFSPKRYYGDLIPVVDPWFWAILGSGAAAGPNARRPLWAALGGVLGIAIALEAGPRLALAWVIVAGAAALTAGLFERRGRSAAVLALVALVLYVAGVFVERTRIRGSVEAAAPRLVEPPILGLDLLPRIVGGSARWRAVLTTEPRYYLADAGGADWRSGTPRLEAFEKNLGDPCYRAALGQPQMAAMAQFARFPSVDARPAASGCLVFLRDLRYAQRSESGFGVAVATVPARVASGVVSRSSASGR